MDIFSGCKIIDLVSYCKGLTILHFESDNSASVHAFSVAPMMELTDQFCRYFHRCLSKHALLYSEMVTSNAIIHGDRDYLLGFDPSEHPVVLQLGGSDPAAMAQSAKIGQQYGYAQINMNVGCPSDRVQSGRFGACLMAEPDLVADCISAMQEAVNIPVTVKCRVGIDRDDAYEPFANFIETLRKSGCDTFVVHARKAWLDGLSPKENRDVPPLRYDFVQRIKQAMPDTTFILNGGLHEHQQALTFLSSQSSGNDIPLDGVMLGRDAYRNPWLLNDVDHLYYGDTASTRSRADVVELMIPYIENQLARGVRLGKVSRHMLGLYQGQPGGRLWRRHISENAWREGAGIDVLKQALELVENAAARFAA